VDLSEIRSNAERRHPWELARASAILHILSAVRADARDVLDYGCGDGFTGEFVRRGLNASYLAGVDMHFPDGMLGRSTHEGVTRERLRSENELGERRFDLILACDVIEHVEDDRGLLRRLARERGRSGAHVLVTVPAFQSLFSRHDRALRHYRRYTLSRLEATIRDAGLVSLRGGYLFSTLLLPRAIAKLLEVVGSSEGGAADGDFGAGGWKGGALVTELTKFVLTADNHLLLAARRVGLTLPGLTAWALCKTPS
jgi:hypothetical protein